MPLIREKNQHDDILGTKRANLTGMMAIGNGFGMMSM
jgi:hypothetical protein